MASCWREVLELRGAEVGAVKVRPRCVQMSAALLERAVFIFCSEARRDKQREARSKQQERSQEWSQEQSQEQSQEWEGVEAVKLRVHLSASCHLLLLALVSSSSCKSLLPAGSLCIPTCSSPLSLS